MASALTIVAVTVRDIQGKVWDRCQQHRENGCCILLTAPCQCVQYILSPALHTHTYCMPCLHIHKVQHSPISHSPLTIAMLTLHSSRSTRTHSRWPIFMARWRGVFRSSSTRSGSDLFSSKTLRIAGKFPSTAMCRTPRECLSTSVTLAPASSWTGHTRVR